jgi:uncharacterized delta-60 repeat protein
MNAGHRGRRRPRPGLERLEPRIALSAAGALDPSFGGGRGFVTFPVGVTPSPFNPNGVSVAGVAVQGDGKVVVGGAVTSNDGLTTKFVIERLDPDGTPDAGFGQGGQVAIPLPTVGISQAASIVIQPDGKIIEAGSGDLSNVQRLTANTFLAARVNPDGTLDTTYGAGGLATYSLVEALRPFGTLNTVTSAALQPDGKLVLVGRASPSSTTGAEFGAVRLNADGSLDTSFGTGGTAVAPITINGFNMATAEGVAVQPDGRIVLAGTATTGIVGVPIGTLERFASDIALVRLGADGKLDTTFGGASAMGGQVLLAPNPANPSALGFNEASGLVVQPDGKLLVVGSNGPPGSTDAVNTLTRLNPDGTVDTGFGQNGRATPLLTGPAAVLPGGKILVADSVAQPGLPGGDTRTDLATTRLNADGSTDTTYGNTSTPGLARYYFGAASINPRPGALAVQPDGKVVVAGITATSQPAGLVDRLAVARVLTSPSTGPGVTQPPPTPPASFDGSGRSDLAVYLPAYGAFAYRPTTTSQFSGDQIIPFGIPGPGQTLPAAADYAGSGVTQIGAYLPAFGAFAIRPLGNGPDAIIPFGVRGPGQTLPAPADYTGDGKADIAAYLPAYGAFAVRPSGGEPDVIIPFGIPGAGQSIPAPADYDGDGKADLAVYLPAFGAFAVRPSAGGPDVITPFGIPGPGRSIPVPGDYDGSGKTELAVYFPQSGVFAYRPANGGADVLTRFGAAGDGSIPVPGDYSGSGHTEFAVYDPSYGAFAYRPASGGPDAIAAFGVVGVGQSLPVAASIASITPGSPTVRVASVGVATSQSTTVPGGPMAGPSARRVARSAVAQARPDLSGPWA